MRNTLPVTLPSPWPSDMSKRSSTTLRNASASWPAGMSTPVSVELYNAGSAHRISRPQAFVTREHVVESFLEQHLQRGGQAVEQIGRGRVREVAFRIDGEHLAPVPV